MSHSCLPGGGAGQTAAKSDPLAIGGPGGIAVVKRATVAIEQLSWLRSVACVPGVAR